MAPRKARILILCKTYPSPSAKHAETSCVAGMEEDNGLIRLYPVPFRLIEDDRQFKKWQWIDAVVEKAKADHRPESHKLFVDTIDCSSAKLPTDDNWYERRKSIAEIPVFPSFSELEAARKSMGITLGLVRPCQILGLDITPADRADWSDEEKAKLLTLQQQGNLFDETDASSLAALRKLPFDFHYRYLCDSNGSIEECRHKIVDREVGALYWNVRKSHGNDWEVAFRKKLESDFAEKELTFLMGTIHRFPDQWLIVSLIYPPKQQPAQNDQGLLL